MAEETKLARRSHWQVIARRKYKRMRYISGDGCWIVLSRCTQPWSYTLSDDQLDAELEAHRSCGFACQGHAQHRVWKIRE
jgi:hypothetical protein